MYVYCTISNNVIFNDINFKNCKTTQRAWVGRYSKVISREMCKQIFLLFYNLNFNFFIKIMSLLPNNFCSPNLRLSSFLRAVNKHKCGFCSKAFNFYFRDL